MTLYKFLYFHPCYWQVFAIMSGRKAPLCRLCQRVFDMGTGYTETIVSSMFSSTMTKVLFYAIRVPQFVVYSVLISYTWDYEI